MHDEVTEKDIERMKEEIEYRKLVVRKEALEAVKESRAHGDLSENFEYHAAKKDKNANESRIRYLERMIKTAVVVSDESKSDEVGINNKVTLYFEDDDDEEVYTLVTTVRGNSLKGWISTESPIGKAILGHKVGDRVYVEINANAGYYIFCSSHMKSVQLKTRRWTIMCCKYWTLSGDMRAGRFCQNKSNAQISCALDLFFYRQRFYFVLFDTNVLPVCLGGDNFLYILQSYYDFHR